VRAHKRSRDVALGAVLACILGCCPCAFALNPALDVSQYAHTAWRIRDGSSKGIVRSIAQTPDGYLWFATDFGLLRFDAIRNVLWQPPADQPLPSNIVTSLLVTRDGTLWIGTDQGLASWKNGKLSRYEELSGSNIGKLLEDREGSIWIARFASGWTLCAIQLGRVRCYGENGGPGAGAIGLYEDRKGNLWVGTNTGLWRWSPGLPTFYPLPRQENGIQGLSEADDGALLISNGAGIRRFVGGEAKMTSSFPPSFRNLTVASLLRDRDGGLWIGSFGGGLLHIHQGITDVFTQSDGLSGDSIGTLFEDREGTIWVSTVDGLDRFREAPAAPYSVNQGVSNARITSVLASRDGSVWLGTVDGLTQWTDSHVTVYRAQIGQAALGRRLHSSRSVHEMTDRGMPAGGLQSIFQDSRGRVWASTGERIGYLEHDRFVPIHSPPGGLTRAIVEDHHGDVWIARRELGLSHVFHNGDVEDIPWARLNIDKGPVSALAADPLHGGLWLGFFQGGVAYFADGQLRASYGAAEGLGKSRVSSLQVDRDGTLWVSTYSGLSRLKGGRVATLTSRNGLPCDGVQWVIEDDAQTLWLGMLCGLVRIARPELDAWTAAADKAQDTQQLVHPTVFDSADGVRVLVNASFYTAPAAKSSDGKLWFLSQDGVSVVDPRHLPFNNLPPPVHIEQITADHKTYDVASDAVHLPALTRDLQIDYTALSLVAPEKMRFRYKLEGKDRDWQDVGTRRQAFYNDLPPRSYRFRVIASNNSGVWNEAGASLSFSVNPAFYQTDGFQLLSAVAILIVFAAILHLRSRQVARQFNMRLEERVNERTRIARDLHDTLLQSFHGVLLRFQAITYLLPDRPAEAQTALNAVIEQASQAVTEGRDAVQGLRPSAVVSSDLAGAISVLGDELAKQIITNAPDFRVDVEGIPRDLAPLLGDEVYRIAGEALRNAFRHANAKHVEVEVHYDRREFRLRIRDDGKGIDPKVLARGGAAGHYGLAGMHERAAIVGGTLTIWSEIDSGTEAELIIPASIAYAKSSAGHKSTASGAGT
jgi:signal transduction histidine kinase/ligand-binding sensor domain-containing protein